MRPPALPVLALVALCFAASACEHGIPRDLPADDLPFEEDDGADAGGDAGASDAGATDGGLGDGGSGAGGSDGGDGGSADAGAPDGGASDAGPVEGPSPSAACAVPDLIDLYPGLWPPNPYATQPQASACVQRAHDVILILGCPSESNGSPSSCQKKRIDLALALRDAGYARDFIVSGAAVHNQWVEADALRDQLLARGVAPERIVREPQARHTDENLYYSAKLMAPRGWETALVVSEDPGHLIMTAVCDANCCVKLGRLTVLNFPVAYGDALAGHYALYPYGKQVSANECTHITWKSKAMCTQLSSRTSCR